MNKLIAPVCALALAATAAGQTGRTMRLLAPALLGQTAAFSMTYPVAAAGNLYAFLWSSPYAWVTPITVPGFTVHGVARVNPNNFVSAFSGLLGPLGTVSHSLAVPNAPSFLGYAWDLQSVDLAIASSDLFFADNELRLYISGNNIPVDMVPIAPGTFLMGSAVTPLNVLPYRNQADAQPVHQVTISRPIWMGKYEVTQGEYLSVMNVNPSVFQGAPYPHSASRPVEMVSWNDAVAYCAALTAQEAAGGRLPSGYQYRLPTEAEWEYCCRAGTTTEFHYGGSLVCGQASFSYSNHTNSYCNNSVGTALVGGYAPNAWGLFDMHGNVAEWCLDAMDGSANYPSAAVVDPFVSGSSNNPYRIYRGGIWGGPSLGCRSAKRSIQYPGYRVNYIGFRVVLAPVLAP